MRESLLRALRHPSSGPGSGSSLVADDMPAGQAAVAADYGLDPSGDADIARVEPDDVALVEEKLDDDPDATLRQARLLWDGELTEAQLRAALGRARAALESAGTVDAMLDSTADFERSVGMPEGFGFEGYDPDGLPIAPLSEKFQTRADALGYALAFVAANTKALLKKKAPFRFHGSGPKSNFVYQLDAGTARAALLADFGNGLPHARYIARHIGTIAPEHLLYLGDVYYAGTSAEYASFVAPELDGLLDKTNVMMLMSNHEMFSKAYPYFSYLDYRQKKHNRQLQQGTYFCLRFGDAFQVIGVDTDYFGHGHFADGPQRSWLAGVLREGRAAGATNVLLTANEPFKYGKHATTKLFDDLKPFLPGIDLWFWGNTHYCGFFDATPELPLTSCIGHGGYPYLLSEYDLDENSYGAPCPARPLFLETQPRYRGTNLRPDVGNNGFVVMHLDPGRGQAGRRIRLEYIDWMKRLRYDAELGHRDGRLAVLQGGEVL
jgi:hypothetical protein